MDNKLIFNNINLYINKAFVKSSENEIVYNDINDPEFLDNLIEKYKQEKDDSEKRRLLDTKNHNSISLRMIAMYLAEEEKVTCLLDLDPLNFKVLERDTVTTLSQSELEMKFNFKYYRRIKFSSENLLTKCVNSIRSKKCSRLEELDDEKLAEWELNQKRILLLYKKQLESSYVPPLVIQFISDDVGWGLFADKDYYQDEFIGEYTGLIVKTVEQKGNGYMCAYPYFSKYTPCSIDGKDCSNITRFINHSPNAANLCWLEVFNNGVLHVILVVIKTIKKGEQFLVHYGEDYWQWESNNAKLL